MSAAQLHLITTHAPGFAILFGLVVWLAGLGFRSPDFRRAALLLFVLAGVLAAPAFLTGRPALPAVEGMPGMDSRSLAQHEEVAVLALAASSLLGLAALGGLVCLRRSPRWPRWFSVLTLGLALLSGALMIWTAGLGGRARHPEISRPAR